MTRTREVRVFGVMAGGRGGHDPRARSAHGPCVVPSPRGVEGPRSAARTREVRVFGVVADGRGGHDPRARRVHGPGVVPYLR